MKLHLFVFGLLFCHYLVIAQPTVPYGNNPAAGRYQLVRGVKLNRKTEVFFRAKTVLPPSRQ